MNRIVLGGAIDLHCHFGPESVVGRKHAVDPFDAARDALALDFKALVLKSHDFPSNAFAYAVSQTVPGVKVYGSVCCNLGWTEELPRPAIGLHDSVDALWQAGAREAELRAMACDNPARLLRLDP